MYICKKKTMYLKILGLLILISNSLNICSQNFYDIDSIRNIYIYFNDKNWESQLHEIKRDGNNKRILAKIVFNQSTYDSVGIKFKGNSSYNILHKKNPLNIKIDYKINNQMLMGVTDIKLSNIFRDPSGIREVLAYQVLGKYMHAPRANFIQVFINDSLYGLYSNIEDVDKVFLMKHFKEKKGAFFKCENTSFNLPNNCNIPVADGLTLGFTSDTSCYQNQYEKKSKQGWSELLKLMTSIWYVNDSLKKDIIPLDKILEIEETMTMLAFNNLFVNLDSYTWSGRNYYMYQDSNKLFHPIMWDLNQCFGGFSHFYNPQFLYQFPLFANQDNIYRPLLSKLLWINKYKKTYITKYRNFIKNELETNNFQNIAMELHNKIKPFIKNDPYFYYSYNDFLQSLNSTYQNEIPGIIELMNARISYLKQYYENELFR